jgi:hypothetical protein
MMRDLINGGKTLSPALAFTARVSPGDVEVELPGGRALRPTPQLRSLLQLAQNGVS